MELPPFFDSVSIRYSDPMVVVPKVFHLVRKKIGKPGISVIDLKPQSKDSSSSGGSVPDPKARAFVREVKKLVSDTKIMKCVFASSEGAGFLTEARREPRLKLLTTTELSVPTAKKYLNKKLTTPELPVPTVKDYLKRLFTIGKCPVSTDKYDLKEKGVMAIGDDVGEMLLDFPRTFANLDNFAKAYRKGGIEKVKSFIVDALHCEALKIARSFQCQNADVIYKKVLEKGCVTVNDIYEAKLSENQFHTFFVASNIFCESLVGEYTFQFDCSAKAAEKHLQDIKK